MQFIEIITFVQVVASPLDVVHPNGASVTGEMFILFAAHSLLAELCAGGLGRNLADQKRACNFLF